MEYLKLSTKHIHNLQRLNQIPVNFHNPQILTNHLAYNTKNYLLFNLHLKNSLNYNMKKRFLKE